MTLPDERYRAVNNTAQFLKDLLDPKVTPRIPKDIRHKAYSCLRHKKNHLRHSQKSVLAHHHAKDLTY